MAAAAESIQPTRGELLKLRNRIKLAERGHELLEEKRDALITEFFDVLDRLEDIREKMEERLKEAFKDLIEAMAVMGTPDVRKSANAATRDIEVDIDMRSIMGVGVPVIEFEDFERKATERGYSLHQTSSKLDEASKEFETALNTVLELAEVESTVKSLAKEIEKTKRRVNSLEHVLIPRLEEAKEYIEFRLAEMEREDFFRLKRIKAKMR